MAAITPSLRLAIESYATALFNAGKKQNAASALMADAQALRSILDSHPKLSYFLESPQIGTDRKHELAASVFKDKLEPLLFNLLRLLIDRERAILLGDILERFVEIAERAEGIYPASVNSARELGEEEKASLTKALEKFTDCKLKIKYRVRPDLLGGIVFRFQDILVDGSVRRGLNEIRERLIRRGSERA